MNQAKLSLIVSCSALVALFSCEDNFSTTGTKPVVPSGVNENITVRATGDLRDYDSNRCPYPDVIHQVFAPEDLYGMKSLVWRIAWRECYEGADETKIPTVFLPNGALYSINYLNNVDSQNTLNSIFSLYYDNKIKKTADMEDVLDYAINPPEGSMASVDFKYFSDDAPPIEFIQSVVENSPGGLVHFYLDWEGEEVDELKYEEGDILAFKISGSDNNHWGIIWIASMSPRIIDIYMTAENNQPDDITTKTATP